MKYGVACPIFAYKTNRYFTSFQLDHELGRLRGAARVAADKESRRRLFIVTDMIETKSR